VGEVVRECVIWYPLEGLELAQHLRMALLEVIEQDELLL
jgi:hypothetical protein